MKIIHISPSYKPAYCYGGPTQSISLLCEALSQSQMDIEVLTTTANGKTELGIPTNTRVLNDGVNTWYFKRITKDHSHFSAALLREFYCRTKTGNVIVHIHSWWNLVAMLTCLIALLKRVPVVLSPRGTLCSYTFNNGNFMIKKVLHQLLGKFLIRSCHIHCTSLQEKMEMIQFQQAERISVIPNFVNFRSALVHQDSHPEGDCFQMIFLSRIDPKKGIEVLFRALSRLNYKWSLTIAGDGSPVYIDALKVLAARLNIQQAITWSSAVSDEHKYNLISRHHLLVLFSQNENFGNVVLESLIVGTPVAISDRVGLASYVSLHDLGWIAPLNDKGISATLHRAYHDIEKRARIRKTAPGLVREHFNQAQLIRQYINLYQRIDDQY